MAKYRWIIVLVVGIGAGAWLTLGREGRHSQPASSTACHLLERPARTEPDLADVVIPPNLAAPNFQIRESGSDYWVTFRPDQGESLEVYSGDGKVVIPLASWQVLSQQNRGRSVTMEIVVQSSPGQWDRFEPVSLRIAAEDIDRYVLYRKLHPTHVHFNGIMGVYQRDLQGYQETCILDTSSLGKGGCLNCHALCQNQPDQMTLGIRSPEHGVCTLKVNGDRVEKIATKFGYSSWHPSGQIVAYSVDNLPMFFHSARAEMRDTVDIDSYIAYYDSRDQSVKTPQMLARKDRLETWPAWSPAGDCLYFCQAKMLWPHDAPIPPGNYQDCKYDLVRVPYDLQLDQWGQPETLVASEQTGRSVGMPKLSPDGRWLSFCMFDYGFFPSWQKNSDLYVIDIEVGQESGIYTPLKLAIESPQSESWHSWSSNSRWLLFSSKKDHGVFTRLYLSYIDSEGRASKPLIVPQRDPTFYHSCLLTYNTPELSQQPVSFQGEALASVIRDDEAIHVDLPITGATPKAGASSGSASMQRE